MNLSQSELASLYRQYPEPVEGFVVSQGAIVDFTNSRSFIFQDGTWKHHDDNCKGLSIWGIMIHQCGHPMAVGMDEDGGCFPFFTSEKAAMKFVESFDHSELPPDCILGIYHSELIP